jgi:Domain of unknown function (DUF4326)
MHPKVTVVNVRDYRDHAKPRPIIYVGRYCRAWGLAKHPLANPFKLNRNARLDERRRALDHYLEWLRAHPNRFDMLAQLAAEVHRTGFPLACWCCTWDGEQYVRGELCHAVTLAKILMGKELI